MITTVGELIESSDSPGSDSASLTSVIFLQRIISGYFLLGGYKKQKTIGCWEEILAPPGAKIGHFSV